MIKVRDLVLAVINAVLYAVVGIATYLGVFAVVVGGVRFWPSVFVPAVFAQVFGPMVGGLGAAIGIFISDMVVHGNALVSLTIGVPANFIGFYILGYVARARSSRSVPLGVMAIVLQFVPALGIYYLYARELLDLTMTMVFVGVVIVTAIGIAIPMALLMYSRKRYLLPSEALGYTLGLMAGSAYIGLGLWLYSQVVRLGLPGVPEAFQFQAPLLAALIWFLWTYYTEIPFLVCLTPPIARAVERWVKRYEG